MAQLQAELAAERKAHAQARITLQAYEAELSALLDDKARSEHAHDAAVDTLHEQVTHLNKARDDLTDDVHVLETAFAQLKLRFDDAQAEIKALKQAEEEHVANLHDLSEQLLTAQTKFRVLRVQAQQKLTQASHQIDELQQVSATEIALLKAKLIKTEAALAAKNGELRNLSALCDELIAKLEHVAELPPVRRHQAERE